MKQLILICFVCGQVRFFFPQASSGKFGGGVAYGFGYSGLQYTAGANNPVFSYPARFTASFPDENGNVLKESFSFPAKKTIGGFTAGFEWLAFKFPSRRIYHGPGIFVSYQKSNAIEANMWALGYFVRFRQRGNSNTGFAASLHIFPQNKFQVEMTCDSLPKNGSYTFGGNDFGDSLRTVFTETKTSLCPELSCMLGFFGKYEIRLSAGYFFSLNSKQRTKIVSENGQLSYYARGSISAPGGQPAKFPIITPGYLYFRVGIYFLAVAGG